MKIISIVGARPQFVKLAPLCSQLRNFPEVEHFILHTGQHYDYRMSKIFLISLAFQSLIGILTLGRALMAGKLLKWSKIEQVLLEEKPDWVLVYGDTIQPLVGLASKAPYSSSPYRSRFKKF